MWDKVELGLILVDFSNMTSHYRLACNIPILQIRVISSQRMGDNGYVLSLYVLMLCITFCDLPPTVTLQPVHVCVCVCVCVCVLCDRDGHYRTTLYTASVRTKH